ncbi:MAG: hypothetical protein B6I35_08870 [Anaerolineaceae bacterium 4572_32.2]|nr:MAG: hypothetical protein B6I35_08870 [Anaerolineaceae bacterium 4572_32.2]
MQYTPYIIPIFIAAIISGGLTLWGQRRRPAPGAGWFTALMFSAFFWALFYILELVSTDLPATLLWSKVQYLGSVTLTVEWLALVLTYTGQRRWLSPRNVALLFIIPLITLALTWTNEHHELIWVNVGLVSGIPFNTLSFTPGAWYWVNIAYSYALFVFSTILLVVAFVRSTPLYRRQIIFLLLFSILTWMGNLAYTVGLTPHGMNLTPITFSVSGLLIAWGLFRYRILDIAPVARDAVVESMSDGVIVLDPQNRVVDLNPVAQGLLGHTLPEIVGQPLAQVLADWPALMELCREQKSASIHTEIPLNIGEDERRIFDLHVSPLRDQRGRMTGRLMLWHDVTERKQTEDKLRQLSRAMEQSGSTIVITDLDGNIEFVNPAFTRITGYTPEEAIGENTRVLKSGEHPTEFYRELWDTITRGEVWQGEMVNRKKNGEFYWEAATLSPVKDEAGRTTHYLAIKEDITARKKIGAALAQEQLKSDALLRNILPAGIITEIKEQGHVAPVLFDCASIMFTDFGNFTATAEHLGPQELVASLDRYFTAFDRVIEKYGLEKLKTIGDGYMCAGGLPLPNSTHAVDIVNAALEILDFTRQEKEKQQRAGQHYWDIRIGISSGPVIAGIVGRQKYAYDVWGDTVVIASRMESSGEIGRVNISRSTYKLVRDQFDCEYRGKVHAKHKGQVEMYFVNGRVKRDLIDRQIF